MKRIVIYHQAAIGDAMIATAVAVTLRHNYPSAEIIQITSPALSDLVALCNAIDRVIAVDKKESVWTQREALRSVRADLVVDLSNSLKSRLITTWAAPHVCRYQKQPYGASPVQHAVDNFLGALEPLRLNLLDNVFPSIMVGESPLPLLSSVLQWERLRSRPLIAFVPGVGKFRPHRAWPLERWLDLADRVAESDKYRVLLIGGADEQELCDSIALRARECTALAGELTLPQTAAMLKCCQVVVSGDTGPAHIAVAVGTPVVGLYGPTLPQRSGPFGCADLVLAACHHCQCQSQKYCRLSDPDMPGKCMKEISVGSVFDNLISILPAN